MLSIPEVKKRFPFSLGSTSYIIPADIIPNVKELAPLIDDIEIILFQSPDYCNIPSEEQIGVLHDLASVNQMTYTVHLPIDRKAGDPDPLERKLFCAGVKEIVNRCIPLKPAAWILHLEGISKDAGDIEITDWKRRCHETMENILYLFPSSESIAIENLNYPWYWHKDITKIHNTSLCCDVGHLWNCFQNKWEDHLKEMLPSTRVIHLHGVTDGKDHISLSEGNLHYIKSFFDIIRMYNYSGIITLEIFNENDFVKSIEVVDRLWEM